jgi:lysozyme family protein
MSAKKTPAGAKQEPRPINFSVRLSEDDASRVEALATAHDWPLAKTLQKLIAAALDAKLVK